MITSDSILKNHSHGNNYSFIDLLEQHHGSIILALDWRTNRITHQTICENALQNWMLHYNLKSSMEFGHGSGEAAYFRKSVNNCTTKAIADCSIALTLTDIIFLSLSATKKIEQCFTAKTIRNAAEVIAGEVLSLNNKRKTCLGYKEISRETGLEVAGRTIDWITKCPANIFPHTNSKKIPLRDGSIVEGKICKDDTFFLLSALKNRLHDRGGAELLKVTQYQIHSKSRMRNLRP
jgi:hypothetical protein